MRYKPFPKEEYIENRKRFVAQLKPKSIAFFNANDEAPRAADSFHLFRQNSDLYWLTGIDQEQTILVLCPEHPLETHREILFLRQTNEKIAVWEGHKYTEEEAREQTGIKSIFWTDQFETYLNVLMNHSENVYVNINENDRYLSNVPYKELRFANELKYKFPGHTFQRSGPTMARLRAIKSTNELANLQLACDITEKALRRTLKFVKPGVQEFEIEAEITHEFIRNRATGHAYTPIIASGKNACVLHYIDNSGPCNDGDVILMDFGAEYANYAADLTRCVPVNGKFTPRQKEVYNAVLRVFRAASAMLVTGTLIEDYHKKVGVLMEEELIKLKLLKAEEVKDQDKDKPLYKKYFMHGTSHFLGLDVHDIGNRYEPMKAGMVFTCEPGIYIPEENLGIRIENDFVVQASGPPFDLMRNIPIEVDEIEALMKG